MEEVQEPGTKKEVRELFVDMIKKKGLSNRALRALGHSPGESVDAIAKEERTIVWKFFGIKTLSH